MRGRRCFSAEQQLPNHSLRLPYAFLVGVKFISREALAVVRCSGAPCKHGAYKKRLLVCSANDFVAFSFIIIDAFLKFILKFYFIEIAK